MKRIAYTMLLTAMLVTMAVAIVDVSMPSGTSVVRPPTYPTSTSRVPPFATPEIVKAPGANVLASADRSTGRVWMGAVGDISSPSPDEVQILFKGNMTRATGTDKYTVDVLVDLPEDGYVRKGSGEIYIFAAIYNEAGAQIRLENDANQIKWGNPFSFPVNLPATGSQRALSITTKDVLPAGNYYVKAGFIVRSNQGGIDALAGGTGSDATKGVKILRIGLAPFYFG
jgi:hypothetical protein